MERLLIPINIITFLSLGYDKLQAKAGGRRIPEKTLLLMGIFGGAMVDYLECRFFDTKLVIRIFGPFIFWLLQSMSF